MSFADTSAAIELTGRARRRRLLRKRFLRRPFAIVGLLVALAFILGAILAPWIAPYHADTADYNSILVHSSAKHLLGTDELGRDLLSRLPRGLQETIHLLLRLIEGVPDSRCRRCTHLELGNDAIDASDVGIDGASLVATNRDRKRDVEQIPRHVLSEVAQLVLRFRRHRRRLAHARYGRFAVGHLRGV